MGVRFGRDFLSDYGEAIRREWVLSNGLGGWCSSTVPGVNTRKYHGLLVSSEKKLLLSKLEEEVLSGNNTFRLSASEYPGTVYPDGLRYLDSFELEGFPVFSYSLPGVSVRKAVFPVRMQDSVSIDYHVHSEKEIKMRIFPLVNFRSIYSTTKAGSIPFTQTSGAGFAVLNSNLAMCSDRAGYVPSGLPEPKRWNVDMLYREDRARGEEFLDSHYCPGSFEVSLPAGDSSFRIACGSVPLERLKLQARDSSLLHRELQRIWRLHRYKNDFLDGLSEAADSFIVRGSAIIAGYHWFSEWGRDSLISLPGLCLATGRHAEARSVLLRLSRHCRNGLIPNILSPPAYNSADASLWFVHAACQYYRYTHDLHFAGKMLETIEQIIHSYSKGVPAGAFGAAKDFPLVRMDSPQDIPLVRLGSDFLLSCGAEDTNLTWMDATENGRPITPRNGKPVELNALWYNALMAAHELSEALGTDGDEYHSLAENVKKSFQKFWNPQEGCLFDVLEPDDPSVRPNQLFALSLPFNLLELAKERLILEKLQSELLTPYGLRSLSPKDRRYVPIYCPKNERAYHNGAVWPYLLGPFISAYLRVHGRSRSALDNARVLLEPFKKHLYERGLGCISEVFDGGAPHNPGGCISQAWNTAELLRVCLEEKLF